MAARIRLYVPQRQTLPLIAASISASLGFFFGTGTGLRSAPGAQPQGLESLRAQLLEWRDIAVAGVVHEHIETSECVDRSPNGRTGRFLVRHIEGSSANPVAIPLHQIFEAARIPRRRDQAIA
jgi:hypothetical protein